MNRSAKGRRNEHRSRRLLEAAGYQVTRAAGSFGLWDLVGVSATSVVLVQVKSNRLPSSADRERLAGFLAPPNCKRLVHVWMNRARLPIITELR